MKGKKNFLNIKKIGFIIISIILLCISFNSVINYVKSLSTKEGLTSISDLVTCTPAEPLNCGTDESRIPYTAFLGTCSETYGATAQDPCGVLLSYCVDEPTPNVKTPSGNQDSSVGVTTCSLLDHKFKDIQNTLTYNCNDR